MTHSDDLGLVCPPKLAQYQVVIVPIWKTDEERAAVLQAADRLRKDLAAAGIRVHVDAREGMKPGAKYYEWEGRGVPLRLEVGPRDVASGSVVLAPQDGWQEGEPAHGRPGRQAHCAPWTSSKSDLFEAAKARREVATLQGCDHGNNSSPGWRTRAASSMPASAGPPSVKPRSRSRPRPPFGCCQMRSSAPRGTGHVCLVRAAERRRGRVGEGVLRARDPAGSPGRVLDLFAEAGLSRKAGSLALSGVSLS